MKVLQVNGLKGILKRETIFFQAIFLGLVSSETFKLSKTDDERYGFSIQTRAKRRHYVADLISGSVADKAGMKNGMEIIAVNGDEVTGLINEKVAKAVTFFNECELDLQ